MRVKCESCDHFYCTIEELNEVFDYGQKIENDWLVAKHTSERLLGLIDSFKDVDKDVLICSLCTNTIPEVDNYTKKEQDE